MNKIRFDIQAEKEGWKMTKAKIEKGKEDKEDKDVGRQEKDKQWLHREKKWGIVPKMFRRNK